MKKQVGLYSCRLVALPTLIRCRLCSR